MAKDYYLILGVGSDATLEQIKSAYRQKAKRWHPDCCAEGSEPFLAIQEAYEVLGDAGRRQAYDAERARQRRRTTYAPSSESVRRNRCPVEAVEPLIPTRHASSARAPFPEPSFSSLIAEFFGSSGNRWDTPGGWGPGSADDLHIEVSLTREQVLRGGRLRLWIPAQLECPTCQGWGRRGFFECPRCEGRGTIADEYPVDISFPPGLGDGSQRRLRLRVGGLADRVLTLHFRTRRG